jgi:hypothetical protein
VVEYGSEIMAVAISAAGDKLCIGGIGRECILYVKPAVTPRRRITWLAECPLVECPLVEPDVPSPSSLCPPLPNTCLPSYISTCHVCSCRMPCRTTSCKRAALPRSRYAPAGATLTRALAATTRSELSRCCVLHACLPDPAACLHELLHPPWVHDSFFGFFFCSSSAIVLLSFLCVLYVYSATLPSMPSYNIICPSEFSRRLLRLLCLNAIV